MTDSEPLTITVDPSEQCVILVTGDPQDSCFILTDKYTNQGAGMTAIQQAVWGARLRALADEIDGTIAP